MLEELEMTAVEVDVVGTVVMEAEESVLVGSTAIDVVESVLVGTAVMDVEESVLVMTVDEVSVVVVVGRAEVLSVVIVDVEISLVVDRFDVSVLRSVLNVLEGVVETSLAVVDVTSELVGVDVLDLSLIHI